MPQEDLTSIHLHRARAGSEQSLSWVVARFTPLLRMQADYRLRGPLRRVCDPDDLVHDVWVVALPRLAELAPRDGRLTPVLLKFLGSTLLHKVNHLVTRHLSEKRPQGAAPVDSQGRAALERIPSDVTSVLQGAARDEAAGNLHAALQRLRPLDREILILRGIEQLSNQEVCLTLGIQPNTVTMRYRRALERLRVELPDSLVDELPAP